MKTNLTDLSVCVVDHSLFLPLASKLADSFGKVWYHTPQWENGFPKLAECIVGDGFPELERLDNFWPKLDEIDLFVFADIGHSGLQEYLVSIGKPVWGARSGDKLESGRRFLKNQLEILDMETPEYHICSGLEDLREWLREHDDKYIKISRYRGDMETWHHVTYALSQQWLDNLAVKFGPTQDDVVFIVEDPVETEIETAIDTYCIDGEFPSIACHGIEKKDAGYLCSVLPYAEMPQELRDVNAKLSPLLKSFQYRQFWAAEVRIAEGKAFLTDPCCRVSSPAGEVLLELYGNLAEIIWEGANGRLIDPEPVAKFGAQVMLEHTGDPEHWRVLEVPDEISQWCKIYNACMIEGRYCIPPSPCLGDTIGSVVAVGDTIKDVVSKLRVYLDKLNGQPVKADIDCLNDALDEAKTVEDEGMKFSDSALPNNLT